MKNNIAVWGLKRAKSTIAYIEYLSLIDPQVSDHKFRFLNEPFSRIHTESDQYEINELRQLIRTSPTVIKNHLEHTQYMSNEDIDYFKSNYDNILIYTSDWFDIIVSFCLAMATNEWQVTQDKTEGLDKYVGKTAVISIKDLAKTDELFREFLTHTPDIQWDKVYNADNLYVDSWFTQQKPKNKTIINYDNLKEYYYNTFNLTWQIGNWKCSAGRLYYPHNERIRAIQDY